jgi:glycosyltransferase involved in cell wall biosynthesis
MISATILTKNSQKHIVEVLTALAFCDEVIVLDSGSSDETLNLAKKFANVKIHIHDGEFLGFGKMHRKATALASNDWILSVDSDEVVSDGLANELMAAKLDAACVYNFVFHNYFNGKHITTCGWYPDSHVRLFNRTATDFSDSFVHEKIVDDGLKVVKFRHHITHYSYDEISDFLRKMQAYSHLFAQQYKGKKQSSPPRAIGHGVWAFIKSFLIKKGCTQGYEGFVISIYNAHTAFWKYMKLYEANKKC